MNIFIILLCLCILVPKAQSDDGNTNLSTNESALAYNDNEIGEFTNTSVHYDTAKKFVHSDGDTRDKNTENTTTAIITLIISGTIVVIICAFLFKTSRRGSFIS